MSASTFRKPETPEEAQLRSAESAISLATVMSALIADPKLLKQLGEQAATSRALTDAQIQKHELALLDIQRAADANRVVADAHKTLEKKHADLLAQHEDRMEDFETYKAAQQKMLEARAVGLKKAEDDLTAAHAEHEQHKKELIDRTAALDGRESILNRRADDLEQKYKTMTSTAQREIAEQKAALEKTRQSLEAKAKKIEETKRALAGD